MNHDSLENPPWWGLVLLFAALLPLLFVLRRRSPAEVLQLLENDLLARGCGVYLMAFGIGVFLVMNYHPLLQVLRHDKHVFFSGSGMLLSAMAIVGGLLLVVCGSRIRHLVRFEGFQRTWLQMITPLAIVALGAAAVGALYWFFVSQGYRIR